MPLNENNPAASNWVIANVVTDSTALAALAVPQNIEPGTQIWNEDVAHYFKYSISDADLEPDVIVAVAGITGARWIIVVDQEGIGAVIAGDGIAVDNTDPQAPIVSLDGPTSATLAAMYEYGVSNDEDVDNVLVGQGAT